MGTPTAKLQGNTMLPSRCLMLPCRSSLASTAGTVHDDGVPNVQRRRRSAPPTCGRLTLSILALLLTAASTCWAQGLRIDAIAGEPFGVGRLQADLPQGMFPQPLGADGLGLRERDGRVLYPALASRGNVGAVVSELLEETPLMRGGPVREQIGGLLRGVLNRPPRTELFFLFRGEAPLHVNLLAERPVSGTVVPRNDPRAHKELLTAWWSAYTASPGLFESEPEYPPLVENYLTTMLARRLNLKLPPKKQIPRWQDELEEAIGPALGTEAIRTAMIQDRILGLNHLNLPADRPLPPSLRSVRDEAPAVPEEVAIEPIAMRVPEECFYVRFGSYANLLWFQDTMARWGGDLHNLLNSRGLDYQVSRRFEERLAVKQTALARMFGEAVIGDVAIIGTDMFFREGAAFGMLFHAKQPMMLRTSLSMVRSELVREGVAKEQSVEIGGKKVSFLHSADGRVHSYLVADGEFFFATTSRRLAERFLETGTGGASLGQLPEFGLARQELPLERNDTLFVYFSQSFFEYFGSPHYRVEMARRLQSHADIELVQLAVLAAAAEGKPGATIEQLQRGGMLPAEFGERPDGSRTLLDAEGTVRDSLRGHYGAFLPVPDTPVERVTQAEAAAVARFHTALEERWGGRYDPLMVAMARESLPDGIERVVVDARLKPFAGEHYQMLGRFVGEPDAVRLASIPGNVLAGEIQLQRQKLFWGVRDAGPPPPTAESRLLPFGRLRDLVVGYVGTVGELGPLAQMHAQLGPPGSRGEAISRRIGLWRRRLGPFTVFSFQPEVLAQVMPQLRLVEAEYPGQLRLEVADLHAPRMSGFVNQWLYSRTREASLSNLRLFHQLQQQLHVPAASCYEAAEFLLGAHVYCALGGEYELAERHGTERWTSTALDGAPPGAGLRGAPPADYTAPPLQWLRGLELHAEMSPSRLRAHAEVLMDTKAAQTTPAASASAGVRSARSE